MGLVNTSLQGQLWGTMETVQAAAHWKGFSRVNTQVGVRGQGFMRVHPQVKVGICTVITNLFPPLFSPLGSPHF